MLKPNVQRPRLRPAVSLFLWFTVPAVFGIGVVLPVLEAVFPRPAALVEPELHRDQQPSAPVPVACSRTLYYYDMAPFVRERVWCGGVAGGCWAPPP